MDPQIVKIAEFTPHNVDEPPCPCPQEVENTSNYMFFRNLITMREHIDEILSLDKGQIDQLLCDGHDWASDHVTVASENITQVKDWLTSEFGCEDGGCY